ncbi:Augurin [Camelus dromedarius]|uniref:Augurin n=1 Tax=Camelus dromedarius TaxID=9838 RepID=A0A5N4CDX7_CAMDR|nr:Augurin [Camelus dromedarius]
MVLLRPILPRVFLSAQRLPRAPPSCPPGVVMAASSAPPAVLVMTALALLLLLCLGPDKSAFDAQDERLCGVVTPDLLRRRQSWKERGGVSGNKLQLMLQKREAPAPTKTPVAVPESKAKEFLSGLRRQRRQLWDRSRPEVQQWYQQFLYMGFDEAANAGEAQRMPEPPAELTEMKKFEDDITYWLDRDRNRHDYDDYYQRHHDEDAALGPRAPQSFRHGASVNYDDY